VTEEGVSFENPFKVQQKFVKTKTKVETKDLSTTTNTADEASDTLLLRPEDSIRHQNNISANIIMALDDVVSSVAEDNERFRAATYRTLRWYDRCVQAHTKSDSQNLFPIVQGALDTEIGGLREQCLAGFRHRQINLNYNIPGYAIGGLAGGEAKNTFWRVVDQCCRALPDDMPRYLMGVGYPLDLVVCTALGVDLFDCVYPTRTARFGVALVPGASPGTLKVKAHEFARDDQVLQQGCRCQPCREGISRARLHMLFKASNPVAVELITQHNIAYMMTLVREMRKSILEDRFAQFAALFVQGQFVGKAKGGEDIPVWVVEALSSAGINLLSSFK
jgi:queuine tRNA-ribosyltransferase catalytic subunit